MHPLGSVLKTRRETIPTIVAAAACFDIVINYVFAFQSYQSYNHYHVCLCLRNGMDRN